MARSESKTVTRVYTRPVKRRAPARSRKSKDDFDWGKVAMFAGGALILFLVFRPRKASAAVLSPAKVRETAAATGRDLNQVLDDLTKGFVPNDPSSLVFFPRFSTETRDGVRRCVDNNNFQAPIFTDDAFCNTCAGFEFDFKNTRNPRNDFCFPRSMNQEAYRALEE